MSNQRRQYPEDHWIRSDDPEKARRSYMDQQKKVYSRVKNAFIRELLGDLRGKRFLDYGCGGGLFTVHAAKANAALVVGVDAEQNVLAAAQHLAREEGVEQACRFISADAFPSFAPRIRFDVILMKDVIEHMPDDQALLDAAASALTPGGFLVLSTQNALSLNYLLQGGYHRLLMRDRSWYGWDPTHLRFYSPFVLHRMLKKAGLRSTRWRSLYLIPYKLPLSHFGKEFVRLDFLSFIDRTLGRMVPYNRLGWNIIVKAVAPKHVTKRVPLFSRVKAEFPAAAALAPPALTLFQITDPPTGLR